MPRKTTKIENLLDYNIKVLTAELRDYNVIHICSVNHSSRVFLWEKIWNQGGEIYILYSSWWRPLVLHQFTEMHRSGIRLRRWRPYFNTANQILHKAVTSVFVSLAELIVLIEFTNIVLHLSLLNEPPNKHSTTTFNIWELVFLQWQKDFVERRLYLSKIWGRGEYWFGIDTETRVSNSYVIW